MRSPARIQHEAKDMSAKLREALRQAVERSGVNLTELAGRVGRGDGYFSQLFHGRIILTVEHVLAVLKAIEIEPADFFADFYGIERGRSAQEDLDARVLRIMEQFGIKPFVRDDDSGGGTKAP